MPIESTQHLYNLPGPQGWEEMRPYVNEKFIPAPLTDGLGRRDALVWDKSAPGRGNPRMLSCGIGD